MLCLLSSASNTNLVSLFFFSISNFSFLNCNLSCSNCHFWASSSNSFLCLSSKNCNVEFLSPLRPVLFLIGLSIEVDNGTVGSTDEDDSDDSEELGSDEGTRFSGGVFVEHMEGRNSCCNDNGIGDETGDGENLGFDSGAFVIHEEIGEVGFWSSSCILFCGGRTFFSALSLACIPSFCRLELLFFFEDLNSLCKSSIS